MSNFGDGRDRSRVLDGASDTVRQMADPAVLRAAWQRVRDGGGAPGPDAESSAVFERDAAERLNELSALLLAWRYAPMPVRAVRIPKHQSLSGRELLLPSVEDRIVQRAFLDVVVDRFESRFLPCSYGYRPGRSGDRAVEVVRQAIRERPYVVDGDIAEFFDDVDHEELIDELSGWIAEPEVLRLLDLWVRAPALRGDRLERRERGLPTGAPVSPLLANVFLHPLDVGLTRPDQTYVRFADDFVICCATEQQADAALVAAREILRELDLELHELKTRVVDIRVGSIAFLGHLVRRAEGSVEPQLATPRTRPLYVTEPGAHVRLHRRQYLVEHSGVELLAVPAGQCDAIYVHSSVQLTSAVIVDALRRGIDVHWLTEHGKWLGRLSGERSRAPAARVAQMAAVLDEDQTLRFARPLIEGKVFNQRRFLQRHAARGKPVDIMNVELGPLLDAVRAAPSLDVLRGIEGQASRIFFAALPHVLADDHGFAARRRRPPTDPVNSLLSFGYTLLVSEMTSAIELAGLDPYIGFLHGLRHGRPSLSLDLIEEFRTPIVDSLVITTLNRGVITDEDFVRIDAGGAVHLRDKPRRTYLREYDQRMRTLFRHEPSGERVSYRAALQRQAQQLAGCLQAPDREYVPVMLT